LHFESLSLNAQHSWNRVFYELDDILGLTGMGWDADAKGYTCSQSVGLFVARRL